MDQKAPHNPSVLHLLPQTTGNLTLECVNLRGVVLPVMTMNSFTFWRVVETGRDDSIRLLPNIGAKRCEDVEVLLARLRREPGLALQAASQVCTVACAMKASEAAMLVATPASRKHAPACEFLRDATARERHLATSWRL